jgi:fatty-acyl-CoA synthase
MTLAELVDRGERFANALDQLGVPQGSAVGVLSENRMEYPVVDIGLALGRRIRVALNSRLNVDDFRFALENVSARAIVYSSQFAETATTLANELDLIAICIGDDAPLTFDGLVAEARSQQVVRPGHAEDSAWISFTSGTTGRPKGIVLSHRAIREVAFNLLIELGPTEPNQHVVLSQPLSHGAGYFVLPYLLSGGGVYIMTRFDAERALALSSRPDMSTLKIVPAMFPALFEAHEETGLPLQYERIIYGASPVAGPTLEEALDRFGPILVQIYGQSEAPATLTVLHATDHATPGAHRASAGRPWRTIALEVRSPEGDVLPPGELGEITIRGPHMMSGYYGLDDETTKVIRDEWLWTKDIGVMDERGYVYLRGRQDEMINSGGFNISPREVEHGLQEHPDVAECVAFGTPDEKWGAVVSAVVTLKPDRRLTAEDLMSFAKDRLTFRSPKRLVFASDIPKNAYGKTDRVRLMEIFHNAQESI